MEVKQAELDETATEKQESPDLNLEALEPANPMSIGLLNGASAFIMDEKYYLDENIEGRIGLMTLIERLRDMSREEITTGALNLYFKSNEYGIPDATRQTIRVVLPEMRKFAKQVQSIVRELLTLSEERNFIINHPFRPLEIGESSIAETKLFKQSLLETLNKILNIYQGIREHLKELSEVGETFKPVIRYAFFFLRRDTYKTSLQDNINEIKSDFDRVFRDLDEIIQFMDRLNRRINDISKQLIPEAKEIEVNGMDF